MTFMLPIKKMACDGTEMLGLDWDMVNDIENSPRCSSYGSLPLELSEGWEDSQLYGSALKHFSDGM